MTLFFYRVVTLWYDFFFVLAIHFFRSIFRNGRFRQWGVAARAEPHGPLRKWKSKSSKSFPAYDPWMRYLRNIVQQSTSQAPPTRKSLNLPPPPIFSGSPSEFYSFKLRLGQSLGNNNDTYTEYQSQILYSCSLLSGTTGQWYEYLGDPHTLHVGTTLVCVPN